MQNDVIFALGLVHLEIAYGSPQEKLRCSDELRDNDKPDKVTDLLMATRSSPGVKHNLGSDHAEIVRRCLCCKSYGIAEATLNGDSFDGAVYHGIFTPLA